MKPLTEPEALNKAAAYCTHCERCISEVNKKLTSWGVENNVRKRIIEQLQKEGFINESRYSRAFVNDKLRFNQWGKIKIAAAMREKHLKPDDISTAIAQIDDDEYLQILNKVLATKHKELKGENEYTTKQKLLRHAASRGFEPAIIIDSIKFNPDEMD